ncbi:MAG: hypothetical protein QOK05_2507 [Chloroflexota bacterium]|nr:hypothetical protein [Chloroflexota bacterium]
MCGATCWRCTSSGRSEIQASLRPARSLLAIAGLALAGLAWFDLGPALAFNDDWVYSWSARHFSLTHFQLYPKQSALAMVQVGWGYLASAGGGDQRALRLSLLPFVLLAAWSCYRLARQLGADGYWSVAAGVTLLATPLFMTLSTSFMSDVPYVALLLGAATAMISWASGEGGRGIPILALLATLAAVLQRQVGLLIPFAIIPVLVLARVPRTRSRGSFAFMILLLVAAMSGIVVPAVLHMAPAAQSNRLATVSGLDLGAAVRALVTAPMMIGLCLVPFAGALLGRRPGAVRHPRLPLVLAGVGVLLLVVQLLVQDGRFFPGNVFTPEGFTPELNKGQAVPWAIGYATEGSLACAAFAGMAFAAGRQRAGGWSSWRGALLVALSLSQLLPLMLIPTGLFDRYYLAVAVPLIPLAAALASSQGGRRTVASAWAVTSLLLGVGVYFAEQQDYGAWQSARDQAAHLAYQLALPAQVQAGYEANATYWELPVFDATGHYPGTAGRLDDRLVTGPIQPTYHLVTVPLDDPRPGVPYSSLAPAKVVVVPQ